MQCGDLEWFYCKNGEIMDANEAMEKRLVIYRRILKNLKSAHNRSNECLPPSGLDESIYYRCDGDEPSVKTALSNPWVKGTEDFAITSAKGVKRSINTAAELGVLPPPLQGMNFLLKSRVSQNPRIMKENVEAIYLLRFVYDPYENFSEVINIIIGAIVSQMPPPRRRKLSDYIQMASTVSNINKPINFNDRFDIEQRVNVSVRHFAEGVTIDIMTESQIRKFIVTAIITRIVAFIVTKHPSFFKPLGGPRAVISRTIIAATLIYSYGTIEKMSEAARRLKNKNRVVYDAMNKSQITMAYYFVEEELSPLITLAASPSNAASDDAFVAEIVNLISKYKN
ncbi:hypothetical protein AB7179_05300 [Providencia manganoxydans]|uniref:Uncharacterized protein n=1 Tax=Providencia manganoxydans TaxID=2923283 RepID=A0ABX7ADT4_9GAMM|nr:MULTISPECIES: hypothetical protein [Providencia]MDX4946100.1 hypothetical protein [Providencia manganoxydans]QQO61693.1 hypothetical protein JI723_15765 [Providencia manganoxydans]HEF8771095.1 hypothetical protein [Providencia stuartii]